MQIDESAHQMQLAFKNDEKIRTACYRQNESLMSSFIFSVYIDIAVFQCSNHGLFLKK